MITVYPHKELGHANHGWLDTRHHFSFADYHNAERMQFGKLRVINDDVIQAGTGFGMHAHRDMEIITFVRQGAITHRDNRGNEGRTAAGDVQVMSAGTGIFHAEHNLESEPTAIFQIWILPGRKGVTPRWEAASYVHREVDDVLPLLVSGREEDAGKGALAIYQNASISGGRMKKGQTIQQPIVNQAYLLVSEGEVSIDGHRLGKGDGAEITDRHEIMLEATADAELILIDVPE